MLRGGALGTPQRFRRRHVPGESSIDDAEPPDAAPSCPRQETPADLGTPSKFVGRTSLIARRGSARPPIFLYSGVEQPSSDHLPRRPRRKPTSATENRLRSARISRVLLCSARTFKGGAKFKYSVERTYLIRGQKSNFNNFRPVPRRANFEYVF